VGGLLPRRESIAKRQGEGKKEVTIGKHISGHKPMGIKKRGDRWPEKPDWPSQESARNWKKAKKKTEGKKKKDPRCRKTSLIQSGKRHCKGLKGERALQGKGGGGDSLLEIHTKRGKKLKNLIVEGFWGRRRKNSFLKKNLDHSQQYARGFMYHLLL